MEEEEEEEGKKKEEGRQKNRLDTIRLGADCSSVLIEEGGRGNWRVGNLQLEQ